MRARVMPTDEFAEFGKTRTAIVMISISPAEARSILEHLGSVSGNSSPAARSLVGILGTIADPFISDRSAREDVINTEGRSLPKPREEVEIRGDDALLPRRPWPYSTSD